MLRLEWNNPKITLNELELFLGNYLSSNYDGILLDGTKLDIVTINPLSGEQEVFIKDWFLSLNNKAATVITTGTKLPNGMRARLVGVGLITAGANQSSNLDWQIPQLTYQGVNKQTYFDGIEIFAEGATVGDTCSFQLVDVNNILGYGAGLVLEEFGTNWYIIPNELREIKLYNAKLVPGLFIRIKYNNIHATNTVKFLCNIFRHLDQNS